MSYQIFYTQKLEDDFLRNNVSVKRVRKTQQKLVFLAEDIFRHSQTLVGFHYSLRKVRFGDCRLFIYIEYKSIFVLAFLRRSECYKRENLNKIASVILKLRHQGLISEPSVGYNSGELLVA